MNNPRIEYDNNSILSVDSRNSSRNSAKFSAEHRTAPLRSCRKGTDRKGFRQPQEENKSARACSLRLRISFLDIERVPFPLPVPRASNRVRRSRTAVEKARRDRGRGNKPSEGEEQQEGWMSPHPAPSAGTPSVQRAYKSAPVHYTAGKVYHACARHTGKRNVAMETTMATLNQYARRGVGWLVRSFVRWFVRSFVRSVGRSVARSLGRSVGRWRRRKTHVVLSATCESALPHRAVLIFLPLPALPPRRARPAIPLLHPRTNRVFTLAFPPPVRDWPARIAREPSRTCSARRRVGTCESHVGKVRPTGGENPTGLPALRGFLSKGMHAACHECLSCYQDETDASLFAKLFSR